MPIRHTLNDSSASDSFKEVIVNANEGDTMLTLKQLMPVRLYKNKFFEKKDDSYKLPLGYNFLIPLISLLFIPYSYLKGKGLLPGFMEIDIKSGTEFSAGNKIIKESFQVKEAIAYAFQKEILKI